MASVSEVTPLLGESNNLANHATAETEHTESPGQETEAWASETCEAKETVIKVYKRRWYILFLFTCLAFLQSGLCNVWTVLAESVHVTFGWSDSVISLMQNWYYGMYIVAIFPFTWLIETKGKH